MNCASHPELAKRIKEELRKPVVFRNPYYKRRDLAVALEIGETLLSQIISKDIGSTFNDLINSQRITYAKRVMKSSAHMSDSLDDIAIFCGFGSRMKLYRCFVEKVGMTPGDFRRTS